MDSHLNSETRGSMKNILLCNNTCLTLSMHLRTKCGSTLKSVHERELSKMILGLHVLLKNLNSNKKLKLSEKNLKNNFKKKKLITI